MIMTTADLGVEPLPILRQLRSTQAWILGATAVLSVGVGVALLRAGPRPPAFWSAVGTQFAIWGLIDLAFASVGVAQSMRTAATPITPQAEADEFLAAEKLLNVLRFSHKLNVGYVLVAAGLLAAGAGSRSAALLGHGTGVALQGGFLLVFDAIYARRYDRLMNAPVLQ